MKSQKGFTLIELLVVIAIIALLLAILLPSLRTAKAIAKRVVCSSSLKGTGSGFYIYASENDDELPLSFYAMPRKDGGDGLFYDGMTEPYRAFRAFQVDSTAPANAGYPDYIRRWGVGTPDGDRRGWKLNGTKRMWGFGALYDAGIIDNGETFYCPAASSSDSKSFQYETYTDGHAWPWWNTGETRDFKEFTLVSYYYLPQSQRKKMTIAGSGLSMEVPVMAIKSTSLSANYVLSVDMMTQGFFTHEVGKKRGVNALYGDGSVSYSHDPKVFGHPLWEDEDVNINSMPAVFRAVIKGIEGKAGYMDMISY